MQVYLAECTASSSDVFIQAITITLMRVLGVGQLFVFNVQLRFSVVKLLFDELLFLQRNLGEYTHNLETMPIC